MAATISTPHYLLDQARRRLTPSVNNFPGLGLVERRLLNTQFPERKLADPPPGSGLKAAVGDAGLPVIGHLIEMLRGGPDYLMFLYKNKGPVVYGDSPVMPTVAALGPDAAQVIYSNRNKDYSQQGWVPVIGPFFHRGLMLLDFEEHMFHRRIMQEAFVRSRLVGYVEQMDKVVSQVIANDWVANDARFLLYPAMKELTLDIASMVFMGHEPGTDRELVTKVNNAFTTTTRAGNAVIRTSVPPFTWWRGLKARELLESYFTARVNERRGKDGNDLLTVLCQTEDEDGNRFSDEDIVNHMIFLMMAAHDTSTSTATTMAYNLAAHPEWQERCRDESDRLGDGPLDIESLEKLESLDLVINEAIRLGDTGSMGDAADGARHRTARLLPSGGHQRHRVSRDEPPAAGAVDRPAEVRPGSLHRAAQRAQATPLRVHAIRRRRTQVHRNGVRSVGDQDNPAPAAASLPAGASPTRLQAELGLRRHAHPEGRHADRAAPALTLANPREQTSQATSRLAHAMTARSADCVGSSAQPIAHSARIPSLPQTKVAVYSPDRIWWNFNVSTVIPRSCSIAVRAATGPLAAAVEVLMRSPTAITAWKLRACGPSRAAGRSVSVQAQCPSRSGPAV